MKRESRVKVGGAFLALILLENGRQVRARLSQISVNGGLLALEGPLDEGIKVTVVFHIGETSIRSAAEMLFPMWATNGYLQPFRFRDLDEQQRAALLQELQKLMGTGVVKQAAPDIAIVAPQAPPAQEPETTSELEISDPPGAGEPAEAANFEPALENQISEDPAPQEQTISNDPSPVQQLAD